MALLDNERIANLYNSPDYERNTHNWEDAASVFRADAFYTALERANILDEVFSILDVGCGSGGVLIQLSKKYGNKIGEGSAKFTGIDLSPKAIDIARKLYPDSEDYNVKFSVELIGNQDNTTKHSVVSLIHVLEHCPDMLEMINLCEVYAEYLYINVPVEVNLFYTLRRNKLAQQYQIYGHLHFFNENFVLSWLKQNGFEILSTVYSSDFEVDKKGLFYNGIKRLRRLVGAVLGPSVSTWLLGGYSFGVIFRRRPV